MKTNKNIFKNTLGLVKTLCIFAPSFEWSKHIKFSIKIF